SCQVIEHSMSPSFALAFALSEPVKVLVRFSCRPWASMARLIMTFASSSCASWDVIRDMQKMSCIEPKQSFCWDGIMNEQLDLGIDSVMFDLQFLDCFTTIKARLPHESCPIGKWWAPTNLLEDFGQRSILFCVATPSGFGARRQYG